MFPTLGLRKFAATCRNFAALGLAAFALVVFAAPRAEAQVTVTPNVVISQVYTRGGEPGATYQSDYVEVFNRGTTAIDINGWAMGVFAVEGSPGSGVVFSFASSRGILLEPGQYMLFEMTRGTSGQPLPSPDFPGGFPFSPNLAASGGFVALYRQVPTFTFGGPCPSGEFLVDVVGYGNAVCHEGGAPAPAPTLTTALLRGVGGCIDQNNNASDFRTGVPNPRNSSTQKNPCEIDVETSMFNLGVPELHVIESDGKASFPVTRTGDTSLPASVEYLVANNTASERTDYTTTRGTLHFAPGETMKMVEILLTNDAADEPDQETASFMIFNPKGASMGIRNQGLLVIRDDDFFGGPPTSNPIDTSSFLARQLYHDFLNREPDQAGLDFWTNNIESCGADISCREEKRTDTSAAFFLSTEFQETGFLVHRLYRVAFPPRDARPRGLPRYREFIRDTQAISRGVVVGQAGWQQQLEANTVAFLDEFVSRTEFTDLYPVQMPPTDYVSQINARAGSVLTPAEMAELSARMLAGLETRATVLRRIANDADVRARETNPAFVLMQYFGYLRRNPDDAPDLSFDGFDFWLGKLNNHGGDYRAAEMVKSFLVSAEYRERFIK